MIDCIPLKKLISIIFQYLIPDPYHLAGSGSVSDDTDPDPGIAPKTNQYHVIKNQNCP